MRTDTPQSEGDGIQGRKRSRKKIIGALVGAHLLGTLVARTKGYNMGGNVIVRCRHGHLFTTIWIPGASIKAVRLGWSRFQRCPVGQHWTLVTPVKPSSLTEEERRTAAENRDIRIP